MVKGFLYLCFFEGRRGNYSAAELLLANEERLVAWQQWILFIRFYTNQFFKSILSFVHYSGHADFSEHVTRLGQIPGARSPRRKKKITVVGLLFACLFIKHSSMSAL